MYKTAGEGSRGREERPFSVMGRLAYSLCLAAACWQDNSVQPANTRHCYMQSIGAGTRHSWLRILAWHAAQLAAAMGASLSPLLPRMKASPYLFFSWPFTYSCAGIPQAKLLSNNSMPCWCGGMAGYMTRGRMACNPASQGHFLSSSPIGRLLGVLERYPLSERPFYVQHTLRARTSVCSMAMFMYPSKQARMPAHAHDTHGLPFSHGRAWHAYHAASR